MDDELPEGLTYTHTILPPKQEAPERCGGCGMKNHLSIERRCLGLAKVVRRYTCGACGWEVTL